MRVVIIGGGPAGMLAGITAAEQGNDVIILEKKERLGRKLLITGKGRCNITSSLPIHAFIQNIPGNGKFLYSAFQNYTNQDIINFLENYGLQVKEERGNRIFPVTDKSMDVLNVFLKRLKELNVKIETKAKCKKILVEENKVTGICYEKTDTNKEYTILADKVILATGGKSYPDTGSTGDGYEFAKKIGHTIITPKPSLVPMDANTKKEIEEETISKTKYETSLNLCRAMQGLNLKNVGIKIKDKEKNKVI